MSKRLQITLTDDVYTKLTIMCECLHNLSKSTAINVSIDSLYAFYMRNGVIPTDAFYKATALEPEQGWIPE